ncbi:hypothetical protein PHMEG_00027332, partial [Phytophthora megakarya]
MIHGRRATTSFAMSQMLSVTMRQRSQRRATPRVDPR